MLPELDRGQRCNQSLIVGGMASEVSTIRVGDTKSMQDPWAACSAFTARDHRFACAFNGNRIRCGAWQRPMFM